LSEVTLGKMTRQPTAASPSIIFLIVSSRAL
jgi:hypothetical protein